MIEAPTPARTRNILVSSRISHARPRATVLEISERPKVRQRDLGHRHAMEQDAVLGKQPGSKHPVTIYAKTAGGAATAACES